MNIFTVDNTNDNGAGSLRQAIEDANATPGTDTIEFNPELSGETITLTSGELQISDGLYIEGLLSADDITISGKNISRIFSIDDSDAENQVEVVIDKLTLTEGSSERGGGAIANAENLTISQSKLIDNQNTSQEPTGGGGAIRNSDTGNLTIDHTLISQNQSNAFGGGITNFGVLKIDDSIIADNQVTGVGGGAGIDNRGSQADITGSLIANNINLVGAAGGFGNGTSETTTIVKNTAIVNNQAENGAGFFVNAGNVEIINSYVSNNQARNDGGGAGIAADGNLEVNNSFIFSNSAGINGGGIANLGGSLTLDRSNVLANEAIAGVGGGIFSDGGSLNLDPSSVFGNNPDDVTEI